MHESGSVISDTTNPTPNSEPRTLYIIDAFAQIFRAYYAIMGGMSSPLTGEPTNVPFGIAGMLLKLFREYEPHYCIMATDSEGKTFRDEIAPDYKANRDAAPDDLKIQIPRVFEICKLFGIPVVGLDGAEADDVIATITRQVLDDPAMSDVRVRIVSKDKDLEQLLTDRVSMLDVHKNETIDPDSLMEKKGFRPDQAIDIQTLTGDTSDNVKGVDGIGPKTAAKLLAQYDTLENLIAHLDEIKGKRKENITKALDYLPITKQLVTLKQDLDLDFDLSTAKVEGVNADGLRELFHELGLRRHLRDLDRLLRGNEPEETTLQDPAKAKAKADEADAMQGTLFDLGSSAEASSTEEADDQRSTAADYEYTGITTTDALKDLVATLKEQSLIAVDTETVGLGKDAPLCGICLAWESGKGVYIPVLSPNPDEHLNTETVVEALKPVLEDPTVAKCGHNFKYDLHVLRGVGIHVRGVTFDSMIGAFLVGFASQSMDWLAGKLLDHKMIPISKLIGPAPKGKRTQQKTMDRVPLDEVIPYAAEDADITLRLTHALSDKIKPLGMDKLADDIEMPLIEVLTNMEQAGIKVDADVLMTQKQGLATRIDELRGDIIEAAGGYVFNVDSPKQLADVLFKQMKLPVVKRTKTGPSTDIEVLERLAEREDLPPEQTKVPQLVVEYRQLTKLVNTYLDNLKNDINPKTGRVHASFHQTGAATGRLSSSDPNLQNIPIRTDLGRRIRKAFIAENNHKLISADYSQIELRVLAHLSEDEGLIEAFRNDMDIHTAVAVRVFGIHPDEVTPQQRTHAKTVNFGIVYGVTPYGLARRIENLDVNGARKLIAEYNRRFPGIARFLDACVIEAEEHGYVTTMMGRRRAIPEIKSRNRNTRALGERLAINTVVQGSAADLIKIAMVNLQRKIESESLPMRLLLQIHDELVVEAPTEHADDQAKVLTQVMESAMSLTVPLKVDAGIGDNWHDVK